MKLGWKIHKLLWKVAGFIAVIGYVKMHSGR